MPEKAKRSGWFYAGIGCGAVALVLLIAIGVFVFFAVRFAGRVRDSIADPERREAEVERILGTSELPDGYHAVMGLSLFRMQMAILSDRSPDFSPEGEARGEMFVRRGFIYLNSGAALGRDLEDLAVARSRMQELFGPSKLELSTGRVLNQGRIPMDGWSLTFLAQEGSVGTRGGRIEGILTLIRVECTGSDRARLGVWFGPGPPPVEAGGKPDYDGTPADPEAIAEFMGHFSPCRD